MIRAPPWSAFNPEKNIRTSPPPFSSHSLAMASERDVWEEIELSERYLVSCMFEEAATSASSVLQRLCNSEKPSDFSFTNHEPALENCVGDSEEEAVSSDLDDMMEAAGMVFIQAYREMGRTSEIFGDLKLLFGSTALIPFSVLLTGVCMQLSAGLLPTVREILDEFLNGWIFVQGESWYLLSDADTERAPWSRSWASCHLPTKNYMEIVELYSVSVLARGFNNVELAYDWLKKAHILEERKQDITEKISSVCPLQEVSSGTSFSNACSSYEQEAYQVREGLPNKGDTRVLQMGKISLEREELSKAIEVHPSLKANQVISRGIKLFHTPFVLLSKLFELLSSWFPAIALRLRKLWLAPPKGNIVLFAASTLVLIYFFHKRKLLKRTLMEQLRALHRGLIDLWQLAFGVQLNPLAAVQPLPLAPQAGR